MNYTIDAENKRLGRVASEAAKILLGKNEADFEKHVKQKFSVEILNASKLSIDEKKLEQKEYLRYSGYPGGQKRRTMSNMIEKKGYSEIIRKAVKGMLPDNKHRPNMMKRLKIVD